MYTRVYMSNSLRPHGLQPARLLSVGILQARMLERADIPFSRGSSQPRDPFWVSCTAGRFFTVTAVTVFTAVFTAVQVFTADKSPDNLKC